MTSVIKQDSVWTYFMDMHSGGGSKLDHEDFWIEADEETAVDIFMDMFDRDPDNVTCGCCGEDYGYWERDFEPDNGHVVVSKENIEQFYKDGIK